MRHEDNTDPQPDIAAGDTELAPSFQHALRLPGCPVCRVLRDAEPRYWHSLRDQELEMARRWRR